MQKHAGKEFSMSNEDILTINSPQRRVKGPWDVVYKDTSNRWAIVVLHWNDNPLKEPKPCLGIRWFYGNQGSPSVRGYATWLIIPNELADGVLDNLPLTPPLRQKVNDILLGKFSIKELAYERKNKYKI